LDGLAAVTLRYDALGRELERKEPDGERTRTEYLPLARRVWDPNDSAPSSPHYDTPTRYDDDGLDRLVRVTERDGQNELVTGLYTYDALGKLTSATDAAKHVRRYQYDGRSRRISLDDPNAGTWTFEYSDGNDLLLRTDPTGRHVRCEYDALGRKTAE